MMKMKTQDEARETCKILKLEHDYLLATITDRMKFRSKRDNVKVKEISLLELKGNTQALK